MNLTRRNLALTGAAIAAPALAPSAFAQAEPIRLGWLAAMTGPSSAPAVGFNRGVLFAAEALNAAGGVRGRRVEIITRDTQGDPTKAVNATQEMISQLRVHAIWGPTNSGESLATTAIMARANMPNIHPCVVDTLIDVRRYPNAFRIAPSNTQWDDAVRNYCLQRINARKVAVIGDTTGYGVSATNASVAAFQREGAEVVYKANIDSTQPDMTPDMLRARAAGAQAIVIWSVSTGMIARMLNTRGTTWCRLSDAERAAVNDAPSAQALMLAQPSVIKRPVVAWPDGSVSAGFDPAAWQARLDRGTTAGVA
jgi:branched-chain amino acid transport system substrate-binding protein